MKIKEYKDVEYKDTGTFLRIRYDDEFRTFFFDIFEDGGVLEVPTVELNKRKVKAMIKFLERCLKK